MITTRQINVNLSKGKLKLRHVSTKGIDAGVRVEPPKEPIKPRGVTSTTLADVADIREKKRRDDIMAERKLAMKDEKKIVIAEKKDKQAFSMVNDFPKTPKEVKEAWEKPNFQKDMIAKEKKPWKEMTDEEKKVEYKERAKRAAATRAAKKKK